MGKANSDGQGALSHPEGIDRNAAGPRALADPPEFLEDLDRAPDRAFTDFYEYAVRLLLACPPRALMSVDRDQRMDLVHEVIVHCCQNDFGVLKAYDPDLGRFVAWFSFVARNRMVDILRQRNPVDLRSTFDAAEDRDRALLDRLPSLSPDPSRRLSAQEVLRRVQSCVESLGHKCRTLILGAADGLRPQELTRLLGWPESENKRASDDLRACRNRLKQKLMKEGFDPADLSIWWGN